MALTCRMEVRDEMSAVLDLWVYRADAADQRDPGLGVCPVPVVQASQHLLGQYRSHTLWETFDHRALSCRNRVLPGYLSLGVLGASDSAVDMSVLGCDHVSRDVCPGRRCENFGHVLQNHLGPVQYRRHDMMTPRQEVRDQSRLNLRKGDRLANFAGRD